jgi:hypothetical protein
MLFSRLELAPIFWESKEKPLKCIALPTAFDVM